MLRTHAFLLLFLQIIRNQTKVLFLFVSERETKILTIFYLIKMIYERKVERPFYTKTQF